MKSFSQINQRNLRFGTAIACLVLAASIAAFAVPAAQVSRYTGSPVTFTGACCSFWNQTVSVTEPKAVTAVLVTWNGDYQANGEGWVGLSLNGGSCAFFGSNRLPEFNLGSGGSGPFGHNTYQWVIQPADGLKVGKNTIGLCGGGSFGTSATIVLGFNTLAAQISK